MDWIDIKKEEPKEDMRVLVYFPKDVHFFNPCIGRRHYTTGIGNAWRYEPGFMTPESPTHWMPLPKIAGSVA